MNSPDMIRKRLKEFDQQQYEDKKAFLDSISPVYHLDSCFTSYEGILYKIVGIDYSISRKALIYTVRCLDNSQVADIMMVDYEIDEFRSKPGESE